MRISDWSSDVCSSDLWQKPKQPPVDPQWPITPKPISLPPLSRLAERTDQLDMSRPAELAHRLRSEEHTSELQSLMRISYAGFCLKKKKIQSTSTLMTQHIQHTKSNYDVKLKRK